jgi:hypothetical protein
LLLLTRPGILQMVVLRQLFVEPTCREFWARGAREMISKGKSLSGVRSFLAVLLSFALFFQTATGGHAGARTQISGDEIRVIICSDEGTRTLIYNLKDGSFSEETAIGSGPRCELCTVSPHFAGESARLDPVPLEFRKIAWPAPRANAARQDCSGKSRAIRAPPAV